MKPVRFIASNDITDDISVMVLVKSVEAVEKAGEEGISICQSSCRNTKPRQTLCGSTDGCGYRQAGGYSSGSRNESGCDGE